MPVGRAVSSPTFFTVTHVTDDILNDLDARVLGLTEDPNDPSARSILFQRSLSEPTDQDRRLGLSSYDVSNEQGLSAYAALESYELRPDTLVLNFTGYGANLLGMSRQVRLELALSDRDLETLGTGLREITEV